jgi:hypothetical protein
MAVSQSRKWNMIVLGVMLLAGVLLGWSPFIVARWQMHRFCSGLAAGTPQAAIEADAAERGYEVIPLADGGVRVHDPRSLGRFTCDLRFDAQGLTQAQ